MSNASENGAWRSDGLNWGVSPVLARIPPGVQTFFDDAVRHRRAVESAVLQVFAGWSYDEIWLPAFDYLDLFARGMGAWIPERTYKFIDREGHLLALRPDFTSLVARTVATRFGGRPRPIRLCYSGEVFRYDEPRHGRQNEFHQIGIEHVGSADLASDLEVLLVALEALRAVGIEAPIFTLSHAGFHRALLEESGLAAEDAARVRELWRRRNSRDLETFVAGLGGAGAGLAEVSALTGPGCLERARTLTTDPRGHAALQQLEDLVAALGRLGLGSGFQIDLGDASALDYYTGITFRAFGAGVAAELGSGGRYDDLLGVLGAPEPAVGMVLYLDMLIQAGGPAPERPRPARAVDSGGDLVGAFAEARARRAAGQAVRIVHGGTGFPEGDSRA